MFICGIDEVGRGSLAGPLVAVAALFDIKDYLNYNNGVRFSSYALAINFEKLALKNSPIAGINDSKKLTAGHRESIFHFILKSQFLIDFGIGEISVDEIDEIGIEQANKRVFKRAISDLSNKPDYLLIDGIHEIDGWGSNQFSEPKADAKYWPVGAASILAKVIRDNLMNEYAKDYPKYNFSENAGYGSEYHQNALRSYGPCPIHRSQFIKKILGNSDA